MSVRIFSMHLDFKLFVAIGIYCLISVCVFSCAVLVSFKAGGHLAGVWTRKLIIESRQPRGYELTKLSHPNIRTIQIIFFSLSPFQNNSLLFPVLQNKTFSLSLSHSNAYSFSFSLKTNFSPFLYKPHSLYSSLSPSYCCVISSVICLQSLFTFVITCWTSRHSRNQTETQK